MTKHDKALYAAWIAGFHSGWEEGKDDNWPVKWLLRAGYWRWRRRPKDDQ